MSKKRTISSFNEVANDSDINKNINSNSDNKDDILKSVTKDKKPKDQTHTFKGYWLENKVANEIDRMTDGHPKGTKSEFINQIIKNYLISEGRLPREED
jgi:16S rRNA U516 pseudouridylate synthase RsuA-like enzyme